MFSPYQFIDNEHTLSSLCFAELNNSNPSVLSARAGLTLFLHHICFQFNFSLLRDFCPEPNTRVHQHLVQCYFLAVTHRLSVVVALCRGQLRYFCVWRTLQGLALTLSAFCVSKQKSTNSSKLSFPAVGYFCRWTSTASVGVSNMLLHSLCVLLIDGHFRAPALCCSYVNFIGPLLVWEPRHSPCHKFQLLCTVFWSGKGLEMCFFGSLCLVHGLWFRIFLMAAQEPAAKPSGSVFLDHLSVGPFWWAILQNELRIRMVPCTVTTLPPSVLDCHFH